MRNRCAVGSSRADGAGRRTVGVAIELARSRTATDAGERSLDFAVAECGEALADRSSGGNRGQALLGAAAMFLLVEPYHRLHHIALVGVQVTAVDQVFRDLPPLVATPNPERGDELVLIDQTVLEGKQSKERGCGPRRRPWESSDRRRRPQHDRTRHSTEAPARRERRAVYSSMYVRPAYKQIRARQSCPLRLCSPCDR